MKVIKQTDKKSYTVITFTNEDEIAIPPELGDAVETLCAALGTPSRYEPLPENEIVFQTCRTYIQGDIREDMGLKVSHNCVVKVAECPGGIREAYLKAMADHGQLVGIDHPCASKAMVLLADCAPDENPD